MMKKRLARIVGTGSYLPERVLSNADLEKLVDTTDEWIMQRTGVQERRIAAPHEASSDMGAAAARGALADAGIGADKVEMLLVATMTPDHITPSTASLIQKNLGAVNAAAMDFAAACSGFLYGLSIAKAYIEAGIYSTILLVATEKMSSVVDYSDRSTCILFGDGAAAVVITAEGLGLTIDHVCLGSDGVQAELISIPAGGSRTPSSVETLHNKQHFVKLEGKKVFVHAVRRMASCAQKCLSESGVSQEQIRWLLPHQANERIMTATAENLGFPLERMYKTIHKYGNTSASGIAIALDELVRSHPLQHNEHLLLVAFGSGLTWGAALLTQIHH